MTDLKDQWFVNSSPRPQADVRLFCFPFAGGGATIYRRWPQLLPDWIDVQAIQLPGREHRIRAPLYQSMGPLLAGLEAAITPLLDRPYAFFGHSMGGLVSYELARRLEHSLGKGPAHLFVSARRAPHLPLRRRTIHDMSTPALIQEIRRMGGTPPAVLREPELLKLILPIVRADFTVLETHEHVPSQPLSCPISAFGGAGDSGVSREEILGWGEYTSADFDSRFVPGGHFFIQTSPEVLTQGVEMALSALK